MRVRLVSIAAFIAFLGCSTGPLPKASADFTSLRETPSGPVVGSTGAYGSHAWLGIPYAQAPVGSLRWRGPREHPTWSEPREALSFGSSCVQFASELGGDLSAPPGEVVGSEDCLFLNVYAPRSEDVAAAAATRRPVLFWIHGGGNTIGTSSFYDGGRLAADEGVVVVTVNYRLGVLGWMRHAALAATVSPEEQSGNFAVLDLVAALSWVRDHIDSFGGDPAKVTIFGESAGGHNVLMLMTSPLARGLFHRAVVQSGGTWMDTLAAAENPVDAPEPGHESSSAELLFARLVASDRAADRSAAKLATATMPLSDQAAFLRAQAPEDLLRFYSDGGNGMYDVPKPFPDGVVLPEDGILGGLSRRDGHVDVPIVLGTNRDENKLFLFFDPDFTDLWFGIWPRLKDEEHFHLTAEYLSRHWKATGVDELAEILEPQHPGRVFAYRFDWDEEPSILGKDLGHLLGASHGFEIPFVFGHWNLGPQTGLLFDDGNEAAREALSAAMRGYWVQFATSGDPGRGVTGKLPVWKPWGPELGSEKWLRLDTAADTGIAMEREVVTTSSVNADLARDERLTAGDLRCRVAEDVVRWGDFGTPDLRSLGCGGAAPVAAPGLEP